MTLRIRLILLAVIVGFLAIIAISVRRRSMRAQYLVLWTTLCVATIPLLLIPGAINGLGAAVGVYYPPTLLLGGAILVLFGVSIHFSREISRLEEKTRILAEELALDRVDRDSATSPPDGLESRTRPAASSGGKVLGEQPRQ